MTCLEHAPDITDLAGQLGFGSGAPVNGILAHCRRLIDGWAAEADGVTSVDALERLVTYQLQKVKADEDFDRLTQLATPSLFGDDALPCELRAVKLIQNRATFGNGFMISTNIRAPLGSVVHDLFDADLLTVGNGEEYMSLRGSQGNSLPKRALAVWCRKVGNQIIAFVQPANDKKRTRQQDRADLYSE